jgi:hypothetical protein
MSYSADTFAAWAVLARRQSNRDGSTFGARNGKLSTTDGPYAETKEQLLGFPIVEARALNDAIDASSKIQMTRIGSIELREKQLSP